MRSLRIAPAALVVPLFAATVLAAIAAPAAAVGPGPEPAAVLQLISTSTDGVKGEGVSSNPDLADDGLSATFQSTSDTLDPADGNNRPDVYAKNLTTGELSLVSATEAGVVGDAGSEDPTIAGDGSAVSFTSSSINLEADIGVNGLDDVFVRDLASGTLVRASTSEFGFPGTGPSGQSDLSRDGNLVAFSSNAINFDSADTDISLDVFVTDLSNGDVTLLSSSTASIDGNRASFQPAMAPSGQRVGFTSEATNLVGRDGDRTLDVYVKTLTSGELSLASVTAAGVKGNGDSSFADLSTSGQRVVFQSASDNLDAADPDSLTDIYLKSMVTGELELVSTSDAGVKGNGNSNSPRVTGDGRRVVFQSTSTNLDPADTDPIVDVYVKDLDSGDVAVVSATPDGASADGRSTDGVLTSDGNRVGFQSTATTIDPADTDAVRDVYVGTLFVCTATGTAGDDILIGTSGRDVLCGLGGADTLVGLGGNDVLVGDAGNDELDGGPGADSIDGGADSDTVTYASSSAGVEVHLAEGVGFAGDAEGDTYAQIENVQGSPLPDFLFGDRDSNELTGADGSDVLAGDAADDVLDGAAGADFLSGGPGADELVGGTDSDTATYSESPVGVIVNLTSGVASRGNADGDTYSDIESLGGSALADTLTGNSGSNTLIGGSGDDVLTGLGGGDVLDAGPGEDAATYIGSPAGVVVELANNLQTGGHATGDSLSSVESLVGSAFRDFLTGTDAANVLRGEAGDDVLTGLDGDDTLTGAAGVDRFSGGPGTDSCDDVAGERTTSCDP